MARWQQRMLLHHQKHPQRAYAPKRRNHRPLGPPSRTATRTPPAQLRNGRPPQPRRSSRLPCLPPTLPRSPAIHREHRPRPRRRLQNAPNAGRTRSRVPHPRHLLRQPQSPLHPLCPKTRRTRPETHLSRQRLERRRRHGTPLLHPPDSRRRPPRSPRRSILPNRLLPPGIHPQSLRTPRHRRRRQNIRLPHRLTSPGRRRRQRRLAPRIRTRHPLLRMPTARTRCLLLPPIPPPHATPSGEHVFLECNPNGQWLWIELATGMPISAAIADELTKYENT